MAVARAQIRAISKRLFPAIPISHPPPHPQITDDKDKFSFLDAVDDSPSPAEDRNRWHVFIERSCLKGDATDQEKMDFYVKTAAQVVGSEEEAKERIYKVTRDCSYCAFGFEMCSDAAYKFEDLDSVEDLVLESTGQVFINGEILHWSLKPKSRENGRFPLPKPKLELESDSDSDEA